MTPSIVFYSGITNHLIRCLLPEVNFLDMYIVSTKTLEEISHKKQYTKPMKMKNFLATVVTTAIDRSTQKLFPEKYT